MHRSPTHSMDGGVMIIEFAQTSPGEAIQAADHVYVFRF